MTTQEQIAQWFDRGVAQGAAYMIVICDTFSYDDYPSYAKDDAEAAEKINACRGGKNMQRLMEVYRLTDNKAEQLAQTRCFSMPKDSP